MSMAYRYRLDRKIGEDDAPTYAFFGINPSTADEHVDDQTVRCWIAFTRLWKGRAFIVGNAFALRATDVAELKGCIDPVGPENGFWIDSIIAEADVLVPCWGSREKIPKVLRCHLDALLQKLVASGKPVKHLGLTKSGDPKHPLYLPAVTPLVDWKWSGSK